MKRRIATAASIWFEIWGVVDPGQKNFDFYRQISEKFQFFQAILQNNIEFCRHISENFDFFRQLKNFDFPRKKFPFTATSGQIILFLFKSNHFRTYFLYMIRYNNISRPFHDFNDPPATPRPKSGGRDLRQRRCPPRMAPRLAPRAMAPASLKFVSTRICMLQVARACRGIARLKHEIAQRIVIPDRLNTRSY